MTDLAGRGDAILADATLKKKVGMMSGHGWSARSRGMVACGGRAVPREERHRHDSDMTADEVVEAYFGYPGLGSPRARKQLLAFARVTRALGETRVVELAIDVAEPALS